MSAIRRLAVFFSLFWTGACVTGYAIEGEINWNGVWIFGIAPVALCWGIWWVISGFKKQRHGP